MGDSDKSIIEDLPSVCLFSHQRQERSKHSREVATAINKSRQRLRKLRNKKYEKEITSADSDQEYGVSAEFNPLDHLDIQEDQIVTQQDVKTEVSPDESDEGYIGSDGHEQKKVNGDDPTTNISSVAKPTNVTTKRIIGIKLRTRAGRKRRSKGRAGAFQVKRLDRIEMEQCARAKAVGLIQDNLFCDRSKLIHMKRVSAGELVSLARKDRAKGR